MIRVGALLKSFIFIVSSALLYPVLALLSLLMCWVVVQAGRVFSEWIERRRSATRSSLDLLQRLEAGDWTRAGVPGRVGEYFLRVRGLADDGLKEVKVSALLEEYTLAAYRSLDLLKVVVRVGPGLGLIGTLIPMGTGLSALGQGDVERLSADLVVAFTTTVVGLFEGMLAYFFFTVRKRWVERDVMDMEVIAEMATGGGTRAGEGG